MYRNVIKPLLFNLEPERAHHLTLDGLSFAGKVPGALMILEQLYGVNKCKELSSDLGGIHFANPIGLAAGLDKNGQAIAALSAMGFGFIEVGTITPKPQPGNNMPRLFRLPDDLALINRMGFNNKGAEALVQNMRNVRRTIPVAINIGKNKTTANEHAEMDYRRCIQLLYAYGDFFVVNVSSPNTPDLRRLQHGEDLRRLLGAVMDQMQQEMEEARQNQVQGNVGLVEKRNKPVFVKIAPDVSEMELEDMIGIIVESGIFGVIATNTTIQRTGLKHFNAKESGGLSGKPLTHRSTDVIRHIYAITKGKLPIIGVGGIFTSEDAYDKIRAGASLVEIYTGMIYHGPALNKALNEGIKLLLDRDGYTHISQAIGADHRVK